MDKDPPRRGRKPSPEIRERVIAAALSAFAQRGIEGSTTREIAQTAGTTERTLFKHFGSKDGLVRDVVESAAIELMRQRTFARIIDQEPFTLSAFTDWHRDFLTERVEAAREAPEHYSVIFRKLMSDEPFRRQFADQWQTGVFLPLARHLEQMQSRREITADITPVHLAGTFYSLNVSYLFSRFAIMAQKDWNDAANIEAIVQIFRKACSG